MEVPRESRATASVTSGLCQISASFFSCSLSLLAWVVAKTLMYGSAALSFGSSLKIAEFGSMSARSRKVLLMTAGVPSP